MIDAPTNPPKAPRDRSPSFPFISLGAAIDRLVALEKQFGRHPTPADKIGPAWGYKDKSSQADQTLGALRSFGLVVYKGAGPKREISISEEGRTYLRAEQESTKEAVIKTAALRPRLIRKLWLVWGPDRPVDAVALEKLKFEHKFSDSGAKAFLKVYDDTVAFARLSTSDKPTGDEEPVGEQTEIETDPNKGRNPLPPPPPSNTRTRVMEGERELTTGLLSKDASFRLIVTGAVGVKEIERLIKKLEIDKEILTDPTVEHVGGPSDIPPGEKYVLVMLGAENKQSRHARGITRVVQSPFGPQGDESDTKAFLASEIEEAKRIAASEGIQHVYVVEAAN